MSGGGGGGGRVYDASKLHLKKELTQIRKAARVLRDPGTTSSWKSPLSSSRSVAPSFLINNSNSHNHHYHHHNANYDNNLINSRNDVVVSNNNDNKVRGLKEKDKERRVFLYNWRSNNNKSSSEKSLGRFDLEGNDIGGSGGGDGGVGGGVNNVNDGSSLARSLVSASGGDDSLSDSRNPGGDSKSDTCVGDYGRRGSRPHHHRRYSTTFRCKDTRLASMASPTMVRRGVGKKSRKNGGGGGGLSSVALKQQLHKQKQKKGQQLVADRKFLKVQRGLGSLVLSQDDSVSLADQSDDTGSYCVSEELGRVQAESPLLSRLRHRHRFLRGSRRDDSSYTLSTPALSTGSFTRFAFGNCRNPSTVGSWDGTSASFDDGDNEEEDPLDLPGRHGCGIWSKKLSKYKGSSGSCYSPSLSDTLRRTGGRLLCGSQKGVYKRHRSSSRTNHKIRSQMAQGHLPLLANSCDGGDSSLATGNSDDELSTNFGELNLEGVSRLDGRRWSSSCRSREGLDLMAVGKETEEESSPENIRSLSQRYRPVFFDELIGQTVVVQSLMNSVSRGRVAPVYLFQGPRGTGKTSTAKIFAAALNCLATQGSKPCGICRECTDFISGSSKDLLEVDGTNKKAIDNARYVLKSLSIAPSTAFSRYKILLVDECHLLPSKAWLAFLKFLEEPLQRVVFIFVTTDLENVPRTVLSRCQKYIFNKIREDDIVSRLRKIAVEENLDVDDDALDLIALNADGSLRDAETMLDQLSLLGKTITTTLVNELVGVIPDNKLLELLELAMSSNTGETVKRARELMDSGVDPLVLMSQLASLIMDIIAGSYQLADARCSDSPLGGRSLSDIELEKLKHALKLLSESEKQLRVSSERSTWFTATLLQLGSVTSPEFTISGSSKKQSSKTTLDDPSSVSRDASGHKQTPDALHMMQRTASPTSFSAGGTRNSTFPEDSKATHKRSLNSVDSIASLDEQANMDALNDIWLQCIERCHSNTLRQLLHSHGKLLSIAEVDGALTVYIAFGNEDVKSRAERFLISITNSIETVLRRSIEVRLILLPDSMTPISAGPTQMKSGNLKVGPNSSLMGDNSPSILAQSSDNISNVRRQEIPMQRIESIIREQRLESAWLQAAERSTPRSLSRLRPERNQVLPQDGTYGQSQVQLTNTVDLSSNHWEDELNREIQALKVNDGKDLQKDQISKRNDPPPISPSLLHQSGFASNLGKEYQGYESGTGTSRCNMFFCWNTRHPRKAKVNQGTLVQSRKGGRFPCFGERRKSRHARAER